MSLSYGVSSVCAKATISYSGVRTIRKGTVRSLAAVQDLRSLRRDDRERLDPVVDSRHIPPSGEVCTVMRQLQIPPALSAHRN